MEKRKKEQKGAKQEKQNKNIISCCVFETSKRRKEKEERKREESVENTQNEMKGDNCFFHFPEICLRNKSAPGRVKSVEDRLEARHCL